MQRDAMIFMPQVNRVHIDAMMSNSGPSSTRSSNVQGIGNRIGRRSLLRISYNTSRPKFTGIVLEPLEQETQSVPVSPLVSEDMEEAMAIDLHNAQSDTSPLNQATHRKKTY